LSGELTRWTCKSGEFFTAPCLHGMSLDMYPPCIRHYGDIDNILWFFFRA
jgi:hypothetical protein